MSCIKYFYLKCSSINGPKTVLNTCQPKFGEANPDISSDCNLCQARVIQKSLLFCQNHNLKDNMIQRVSAGIISYLRDWFSERVLGITYHVSLLCKGKRVTMLLTFSLFFLCIKYSKKQILGVLLYNPKACYLIHPCC